MNGTDVNEHAVCVQFIERRCRVGDCEVEIAPAPSSFARLQSMASSALGVPFRRVPRVRSGSALVNPFPADASGGQGDCPTQMPVDDPRGVMWGGGMAA